MHIMLNEVGYFPTPRWGAAQLQSKKCDFNAASWRSCHLKLERNWRDCNKRSCANCMRASERSRRRTSSKELLGSWWTRTQLGAGSTTTRCTGASCFQTSSRSRWDLMCRECARLPFRTVFRCSRSCRMCLAVSSFRECFQKMYMLSYTWSDQDYLWKMFRQLLSLLATTTSGDQFVFVL